LVGRAYLCGDNRLVTDKWGNGEPSPVLDDLREVSEPAIGPRLRLPIDFSFVCGADWRAKGGRRIRGEKQYGSLSVCSRRMAPRPASGRKRRGPAKNYCNNQDCAIRAKAHDLPPLAQSNDFVPDLVYWPIGYPPTRVNALGRSRARLSEFCNV
jgi:hypothetical protein